MTAEGSNRGLPWPIGSAQYRRVRELASRMLADYPRVRQTDDTSDVAHSALIRLKAALETAQPTSELHFWRLVALAIRRTLTDLARQTRALLPLDETQPERSVEPAHHRASWEEFHERTRKLPQLEREVLELHWYAGLTQEEVADLLSVDVRTVQRRWRGARESLHKLLYECIPTSAILRKPRNGQSGHD